MRFKSRIVEVTYHYTIRVIDSKHGEVSQPVIDLAKETTRQVFAIRKLPGHLFMSLIAAESMRGEEGEEAGFGMYHSSLQHVVICALRPDHPDLDEAHWLHEVRKTIAHEIIHYGQDLEGTLFKNEECEDRAERLSEELCRAN